MLAQRSGQAEDVRDSRRQGINERRGREGREDGHFQLLSLSASPPSVKREGEAAQVQSFSSDLTALSNELERVSLGMTH